MSILRKWLVANSKVSASCVNIGRDPSSATLNPAVGRCFILRHARYAGYSGRNRLPTNLVIAAKKFDLLQYGVF